MRKSDFEQIRTATHRIAVVGDETYTWGYAVGEEQARAKQEQAIRQLKGNGWGRVDGPPERLYKGLKSIDVKIVQVAELKRGKK